MMPPQRGNAHVMKRNIKRAFLVALLFFAESIGNCFAHAPWVTLQGGHYLIKRPNDGGSFHVSVEGHEYIFRLYFVDAPEPARNFATALKGRRNTSASPLTRCWKSATWPSNLRARS
jgi:hypothetical protein